MSSWKRMEKLGHGRTGTEHGVAAMARGPVAALPRRWVNKTFAACPCATKWLYWKRNRLKRCSARRRKRIMGGPAHMPHGAAHEPAARPEAAVVAALGKRSLVLVGMMGAGKSSIGRRLALRLGIPFIDAEAEIEKAANMTIPDIFAIRGEAEFRAGEARVIARLLETAPQVLATGGGAFMNPDTRATIAAKGISIWLRAEFDVLMKRIKRRQ